MSATVILSILITTLLISFWLEFAYFKNAKPQTKMYFKVIWAIFYLIIACALYVYYPDGYVQYAFLAFSGIRFYSAIKFYKESKKTA